MEIYSPLYVIATGTYIYLLPVVKNLKALSVSGRDGFFLIRNDDKAAPIFICISNRILQPDLLKAKSNRKRNKAFHNPKQQKEMQGPRCSLCPCRCISLKVSAAAPW